MIPDAGAVGKVEAGPRHDPGPDEGMRMATRTKAVFLDVDGTLVDPAGRVPASAARAVRGARGAGHRVFLCTGRSLAELWPALLGIGFDGLIAAAGAYVEAGGEVLAHRFLPEGDLRRVVDFFDRRGTDFYLQANDGIYASRATRDHLRRMLLETVPDAGERAALEDGLFAFVNAINVDDDPFATDITKVIFLRADVTVDEVRTRFAGAFDVVPTSVAALGPNTGEMTIAGLTKASGIEILTAHLGIDRDDTLAIGDGYNDVEMLQHVAVGIAMGNAPREIREVADEVTASADEDGIALAFRRHGLLAAPPR